MSGIYCKHLGFILATALLFVASGVTTAAGIVPGWIRCAHTKN